MTVRTRSFSAFSAAFLGVLCDGVGTKNLEAQSAQNTSAENAETHRGRRNPWSSLSSSEELLRLVDFAQPVRLRFIADKMRIFFSTVLVELVGFVVLGVFYQQVQRFAAVLAGFESTAQHFWRELASVNRNYFHSWTDSGFCGDHAFDSVDNASITLERQADRVIGNHAPLVTFCGPHHLRRDIVVNDLPSATFDAAQWCARAVVGQTLSPERAPIIRCDLVQPVHDVVEGIRLDHGRRAGSPVEEPAKIIKRFLAFALLSNDRVHPKPVQIVFVIEVHTTPPRTPGSRRGIKLRCGSGCVLKFAPVPAGHVVQLSRGNGQIIPRLVGRQQTAAGGQHLAQVLCKTFVDPEQIVLHRLLVVRCGEVRRTSILSIPRMYVLMGKQTGRQLSRILVHQSPFVDAAVVRLVVFEAKMGDMIAQTEQKVIIAIVLRAEKFSGLLDQALVVIPDFLCRRKGSGAVGRNVHLYGWVLSERNDLQKFTGDYGRVHKRGKRNGGEMNVIAALIRHWQRCPESPALRNP